MSFEVINGDCLEVMPRLIERGVKVELCAADIPYFEVKDEDWDNQWESADAYLAWVGRCLDCVKQLLAPNGSLYLFTSTDMSGRVEMLVRERFNFLNRIRWEKGAGWHNKAEREGLRSYLSPSEDIIFAEQYGDQYAEAERALHKQVYAPIGRFIQERRRAAGLKRHEVDTACAPTRKPTGLCYRWEEGACLPTLPQFVDFLRLCGDVRDYEALRRDYEALRRPFSVPAYATWHAADVWHFPTVQPYEGKHVCEKPLEMMRHIVTTSSREGDTVLDFTAGSFKTGVACVLERRNFIGIERDAHWCDYGRAQMKRASGEWAEMPRRQRAHAPAPLFDCHT